VLPFVPIKKKRFEFHAILRVMTVGCTELVHYFDGLTMEVVL